MNNFGMNPMGMNPLLMNNMNNIGMNIQPNLMDNTALNIKSIIQPYENKIRELEEIIKQKDFEIIVLKQKLNNIQNNNMNMMNHMMNMNMNMMNQPEMMFNNNNNSDEIFINIKSNIKNIKCFKNDKVAKIKKSLYLTYNYKPLSNEETLEKNGILNGSILGITDEKAYNITFKASSENKKLLTLIGNCPINYAIKLYCELFKDVNVYQLILSKNLNLIYNTCVININDNRYLRDLFLHDYNPTILVCDNNNIIGG